MIDAIRKHAIQIAEDSVRLAELLAGVDDASVPPLVQAFGLGALEVIRADLAAVSADLEAHARPRRSRPAATH